MACKMLEFEVNRVVFVEVKATLKWYPILQLAIPPVTLLEVPSLLRPLFLCKKAEGINPGEEFQVACWNFGTIHDSIFS